MESREPSTSTPAPDQLEYHTPAMSPFDRPIDDLVRRVDRTKRVVWFVYRIILLLVAAAIVWFFWSRREMLEALLKKK